MTRIHSHHSPIGRQLNGRWANAAISVVFALVVAAGAKGAFEISGGMMTSIAAVGAWMMFAFGLAYTGVRVRPKLGGALLVGFGLGAVLVVIFGGMQMIG